MPATVGIDVSLFGLVLGLLRRSDFADGGVTGDRLRCWFQRRFTYGTSRWERHFTGMRGGRLEHLTRLTLCDGSLRLHLHPLEMVWEDIWRLVLLWHGL